LKELTLPGWLSPALERFHAGASHLFVLAGNVRDVHPFGEDHLPLVDGLRRLMARRLVSLSYDVSSGLVFPDQASQKAFRQALGLRSGALPADPSRALVLFDALLGSEKLPEGGVGLVIDYAHALVPAGATAPAERLAITTLSRWATEPAIAARRPLIFLLTPSLGEIAEEITGGSSGAEAVPVPRPDLAARRRYLEWLGNGSALGLAMPAEELARETGGLALVQIEDIVQRASGAGKPLDRTAVVNRKVELLRQEYGDVLEIIEPRFGLDAVGGLEHAVSELSRSRL
jgi:hypothetical protein